MYYASEENLAAIMSELKEKIASVSANPMTEKNKELIDRLGTILDILKAGVARFVQMRQLFHCDFNTALRMCKILFMDGEENAWTVALNNGQELFALKLPQHCQFTVRDIVTGQVDIQLLLKHPDGTLERRGNTLAIVHRGEITTKGRHVAQVKVPDFDSVLFDSGPVISQGIQDAINGAEFDAANESQEAKDEKRRALELASSTWRCADRDLNEKILAVQRKKLSENIFDDANILSLRLDAQILAIFGTSRSSLEEIASRLDINYIHVEYCSFAVVRVVTTLYLIHLGDSNKVLTEVARSIAKDPKNYEDMRSLSRSFKLELAMVDDESSLLKHFVALNGGSATVDSIGFKLFDGSVIRVGNELFMFSAATTDEIKEATTLR